jgi:hypothetical protein
MKKVLFLFLAMLFVFVFTIPTFAAESKATNITVTHEITLSSGTINSKTAFDAFIPKNKAQEMFNAIFDVRNLFKRTDVTDYQIIVPSNAKIAGISSGGYAIKTAIWENSFSKTTGMLWWKKTIPVKEKHALLILDKNAIYQKLVSEGDKSFSSFSKLLTIK